MLQNRRTNGAGKIKYSSSKQNYQERICNDSPKKIGQWWKEVV